MGDQAGDRAVLLGGSMGALLAARVLAERFAEVVLVDRDELTGVTGYRRGVPHGRHAHGLVARGHQVLEQQFPGLTDAMAAAGVPAADFNGDIRWYVNGQRLKPMTSGLATVPTGRPFLEEHVRERVLSMPNVVVREQHDILGLTTTPDGGRVTGARVQSRVAGSRAEELTADLVIDTTGRGSRTPVWLAELGYDRPAEERIRIDLAYTTRHFKLDWSRFGADVALIPAPTPVCPRGAFLYKLPDGSVELSLTGMLGDHAPTDPEGFLEFARSLPVPEIYDAVRDAEPVDDAVTFRFQASVWRHYERLSRFPERFLVMGDAVCSFNPLYAQGMTVAALESLVLRRHLATGVPSAPAFFRDVAKVVRGAWDFSAGADLGYPAVEGRRTARIRMANAYVSRLQQAAVHDEKLANAFIRAAGLVDPAQAVLHPKNSLRVLWHMLRGRTGAPEVPARRPTEPVRK